MTKRIYGLSGAVGVATLAMLSGGQLRAQTPTFDPRWQAWLGCWQPSEAVSIVGTKPSGVCVAPINASSAVEVTTVQEGAVTARDTVDASGVERRVDKQGCAGTQAGQWSADNRRVFVHSTMTCTGGLSRTGNAIIAMTPYGDWVNVQTLTVGKTTGVRSVHYRDANSLKLAPPDIADAIGNRQLAINAARTEAGAIIDVPAVLEAVHRTDTTAVQSWIVERGTKFNLNARQIVALADAGIPSSVTDVMIGVSYPDHFALKPSAPTAGLGGFGNAADVAMADRTSCASLSSGYARSACERCRDGWSYDSLYGLDSTDCGLGYRYGYSAYSPFGYPLGYGSGYGSGGYGYPYYPYYGYSSAPVVVVKGEDQPHGRVVNGHGYSQHPSSGSSGSTGGSSSSGSSGSYTGSTGSGASTSSAPSSGSSGSSGGGEVRTAHPRPPM